MLNGTPRRAGVQLRQAIGHKTSKMSNDKLFMSATSVLHVTGNESGDVFLDSCTIKLDLDNRLDESGYYMKNIPGSPNIEGCKVMINAFVEGIATVIRHGHAHGLFKESEEIRKAIDILGKSFATPADLTITHNVYEQPNKGA